MLALLAELIAAEGTALLFITHDVALVPTVADDVVVMRHGVDRRVGDGRPSSSRRHSTPTPPSSLAAAAKTALPPDEQLDVELAR